MKKYGKITVYEDDDKLLMQEGTWEIRTTTRYYGLHSYIVHQCPALTGSQYYGRRFWWSLPIIESKCDGCHKTPPPDIMGLWRLHNWDYVQAGIDP